ncbi:hypothetical protein [Coleofasciculus sp. FACHB-1120]|nr:hypothetical protein [Coleofasciculus sp. FACHB-1120]
MNSLFKGKKDLSLTYPTLRLRQVHTLGSFEKILNPKGVPVNVV